jgi:predicted hydrocarbon binding protein
MKRRELLGRFCGMGMCSCAAAVMLDDSCIAAQENNTENEELQKAQRELFRKQWWLDHTSKQLAKLWELLEPHLNEKQRLEIIEQLGRNCAKTLAWAEKYKGNPKGFFEHMERSQGEKFEYDQANGIIKITTPERDCVCGLVNSKITPAYFCQCSIGWQKYTYETILDKTIDVELKESVLRGSKRCVFEVRIRDEKPS